MDEATTCYVKYILYKIKEAHTQNSEKCGPKLWKMRHLVVLSTKILNLQLLERAVTLRIVAGFKMMSC